MDLNYDHELLIKEYKRKKLLNSGIECEKNASVYEFWNAIEQNQQFEITEKELLSNNEELNTNIDNNINFINKISLDSNEKDKTMRKLEEKIKELNTKRLEQMSEFTKSMSELAQKFDSLDQNLVIDNVKEEVIKYNEESNLIFPRIEQIKNEIDSVKKTIESLQIGVEVNVKDISNIVQKESQKLFGNDKRFQRNINEINEHISLLKNKIEKLN